MCLRRTLSNHVFPSIANPLRAVSTSNTALLLNHKVKTVQNFAQRDFLTCLWDLQLFCFNSTAVLCTPCHRFSRRYIHRRPGLLSGNHKWNRSLCWRIVLLYSCYISLVRLINKQKLFLELKTHPFFSFCFDDSPLPLLTLGLQLCELVRLRHDHLEISGNNSD